MFRRTATVLMVLLAAVAASAETVEPNEHLAPFANFVGKTWQGRFTNSTPDHPQVDVARWEWALNGQAIRILHSINDGEYGGETLLIYDTSLEKLVYFYFTTAGFYTTGTMLIDGDAFVAYEEVVGAADGTTAVRSTSRLLEDGRLETSSEYLKDGKWAIGHGAVYEQAPDAVVKFKTVDPQGN